MAAMPLPRSYQIAEARTSDLHTGADGLKNALGLLWQQRHQCPTARIVPALHDEIVLECDAEAANDVAAWLKQAMIDAMAPLIAPVPVEVGAKIGQTWAG